MSQLARNMLGEQRKRLVGSLMGYLEKEVYPQLTQPQREKLREKVIGSVSAYHDVSLDLLKSAVPDGTVLNDEAIRLIADQVAVRVNGRSDG